MAKPYKQYRHRRTGLIFRFAYDDADPELLHIYARHVTTPEDAIRTFFTGHTEWDAAHARFETRSETHTLTWFWVVPNSVVQVLTCMREA